MTWSVLVRELFIEVVVVWCAGAGAWRQLEEKADDDGDETVERLSKPPCAVAAAVDAVLPFFSSMADHLDRSSCIKPISEIRE
jgi:hypothetical protein